MGVRRQTKSQKVASKYASLWRARCGEFNTKGNHFGKQRNSNKINKNIQKSYNIVHDRFVHGNGDFNLLLPEIS